MRKLLSLLLALVLCVAPLAGCGGGGNTGDGTGTGNGSGNQGSGNTGSKTRITMWGYGDTEQEAEFRAMVDAFNKSSYANQEGIQLRLTWYAETLYNQTINNGSAAVAEKVDIIFVNDRNFKKWASEDYIVSLKDYTSSASYKEKLSKMWDSIHPRFRLNKDGYTSYEDDPYWGIPVDTSPTALYYNRTALENVGVIVISVDDDTVTADNFEGYAKEYAGLKEEHIGSTLMNLWNANKIADKFGQYHDTCGNKDSTGKGAGFASDILKTKGIKVPAKGYYRNDVENNYLGEGTWQNPNAGGVTDIVKVFNASIAMNWDEMEDVAHLLTKQYNEKTHNRTLDYGLVDTTYGYYSEWQYCYDRSVGGDSLQDTTGEGTWMYGRSDWSANYKVTEAGAGYVGENTGKVYRAGETLKFLDKIDVKAYSITTEGEAEGDIILPNNTGGIDIYDLGTQTTTPLAEKPDADTGNASIRPFIVENSTTDVSANPSAMFVELPSTREATDRYLSSIAVSTKKIMPKPTIFNQYSPVKLFGNGTIAFVVENAYSIGKVRTFTGDYGIEWGVAPLPQYKEYVNPLSSDVTIARYGVEGGHSESIALCITKGSKYRQLAWKVIDWLTGDYVTVNGQQEIAGQYVKAQAGFIPNQPSLASASTFIKENEKNLNLEIFFNALDYEKEDENAYLPDNAWTVQYIYITSTPQWIGHNTRPANIKLARYSYYFGESSPLKQAWYSYFGLTES